MCIEGIVCDVSVVFLRHSVVSKMIDTLLTISFQYIL